MKASFHLKSKGFLSACLMIFSIVPMLAKDTESDEVIESLKLKDGRTYESVTVREVSIRGISVIHSTGAKSFTFDELPDALAAHYREILDAQLKEELEKGKELYLELKGFKDEEEFHRVGFVEGGPYRRWYEKVHAISRDEAVCEAMLRRRVGPMDLMTLGLEWRSEKGRATNYTKFITKELDAAFHLKAPEQEGLDDEE